MQTIKIEHLEIPVTEELKDFFNRQYQNEAGRLVDDFLVYLRTKKEASDLSKALQEVSEKKTSSIKNLLDEL